MKKILVVVESLDVNVTSGAKANMALINALLFCNYKLTILHYTRKEIIIPNVKCVNIKENKRSFNYILSRTQRVFQRITKINLSKNLERLFGHSFTFFNDSKSIAIATQKYCYNHDLVLTLSQGASFRPHHALLSLPLLHNKWLAYIHDPYPLHYYPEPYKWVEPGFRKKELFFKKVSNSAKYSAFPSELLKEWMGQFFPNFITTGLVIPHQQLKIDSIDDLGKFKEIINKDQFLLLHAGNLMKQRSPFNLIKAFKLFLETNPKARNNSKLLFIGPAGYHKKNLEAELNGTPQLQLYLENTPFNIVNTLQHQVSVNIILESEAQISPFLPGKFPHCVFANKPILVIGPNRSETKRLLGKSYEYQAESNEVFEISKLIEKLYNQWGSGKVLELNRPDLLTYLSPEYLGKQIEKI
ncbi:UDP-glycosyltransferase [Olleya namhaensis]|uniref:UDP-glycosyltransferase n=1 Tax=Olleya namhaensis TaxID=1144750 RepID=UPI002490E9A7|nr:UDP-glycosyltransferase [Olleya namhaensis]